MTYDDLMQGLDAGSLVLMDGATGTEIERLGVEPVQYAWSSTGALNGPDIVRSVHASYLEIGAQIVISNTFSTSWQALVNANMSEHFESLNRTGVELACEAISQTGANALVAGGISHDHFTGTAPTMDTLDRTVTRQAEIMRDAGASLLILEMMVDIDKTLTLLRAAQRSGLPVWVGFSTSIDPDGSVILNNGLPLAEGINAVAEHNIDLISIMHTEVAHIHTSLQVLNEHWSGHVGVYAHSGRWEDPNWFYDGVISEKDYAAYASEWLDAGVQAIGGCCGIGPGHILALRNLLETR